MKCRECFLISVPAAFHLSHEEERARYETHENNPEDPGYREFLGRLTRPLAEKLEPAAEGLDYGSGPGPTVSVMMEEGGFVMRNYDPFFCPDAVALERRYDFITCTETAEHFAHPQEEFKRLNTLLKSPGYLAVMTEILRDERDFPAWYYHRDPTHICFYQERTLEWIAEAFDWDVEHPHPNVAIFCKKA